MSNNPDMVLDGGDAPINQEWREQSLKETLDERYDDFKSRLVMLEDALVQGREVGQVQKKVEIFNNIEAEKGREFKGSTIKLYRNRNRNVATRGSDRVGVGVDFYPETRAIRFFIIETQKD